jgi:hypothetical protein
VLTKYGNDEAHDVKATVTFEDERVTVTAESVSEDGQELVFELRTAVSAFRSEVRERRQELPSSFGGGLMWGRHTHRVAERVEWNTPRGNPKLHEHSGTTLFDRFYPN